MSANLPALWSEDAIERAQDARDHYCKLAFDELRADIVEALMAGGAAQIVQAPAFGSREPWTLAEVVTDDMAGPDSSVLADMLATIGRLARSGDAQALAIIDGIADRHAHLHQAERADEMRAEAEEFDEPWSVA